MHPPRHRCHRGCAQGRVGRCAAGVRRAGRPAAMGAGHAAPSRARRNPRGTAARKCGAPALYGRGKPRGSVQSPAPGRNAPTSCVQRPAPPPTDPAEEATPHAPGRAPPPLQAREGPFCGDHAQLALHCRTLEPVGGWSWRGEEGGRAGYGAGRAESVIASRAGQWARSPPAKPCSNAHRPPQQRQPLLRAQGARRAGTRENAPRHTRLARHQQITLDA